MNRYIYAAALILTANILAWAVTAVILGATATCLVG